MLEFDYPLVFLLLPLPLIIYWLSPDFRDRGEAVRTPFFTRLVKLTGREPALGAVVITKNFLQRLNAVLVWVFMVAALARPEWAGEPIVREMAARDMLLIVDLSGSMEAEDFTDAHGERVTRLEAVKQVLDEFMTRRAGDRLGLVVFGSAAFLQAPFTEDHDTVRVLLEELQPRMPGPQTMIGDAIGLAVRLFEASATDNKVAIMLTDGNDTGSKMPVAKAAGIAARKDITVHTIAMGDPATVGEEELDIPALREVSAITGGRFFLALNRDELEAIYDELDRIEPDEVETISYRPKRSLYHYPLSVAIASMLVLVMVMLVRRPLRGTRSHA